MKVLVYVNDSKKESEFFLKNFCSALENEGVDYSVIGVKDLKSTVKADAVFVLGGDGTILALTEFCNLNGIPIIGINAGKMGFLTEFEQQEAVSAVKLLKEGELKCDSRATLSVSFNGKTYYGLNDAVVQRTYTDVSEGLIISVSVSFDDIFVDKISGDGVIVSTPTGSTAYSLSAGGAILAPGIDAFIMTPLSAHSLHHRPIVFSAESKCVLTLNSASAGLFIDGKKAADLKIGDIITICKTQTKTMFLRKKDSDFYLRLDEKLNN